MADPWAVQSTEADNPWAVKSVQPARAAQASKPKAKPSTAKDVAKSAAVGVGKGIAGIAAMVEGATPEGMARNILARTPIGSKAPTASGLAQNALARPDLQPETRAGRYAESIGENAVNVLAPGGIVRRVASVVLPGVAGEGARELASASGAGELGQTAAKFAGNVLGGFAASTRMPQTVPTQPIQRLAKRAGVDPTQLRARADEMRAAGVEPTLTDIVGPKGRRVIRAVGVKSEAAGETLTNRAREVSSTAKPEIMARTSRVGPMRGMTAEQLKAKTEAARDAAARTNYRGPYAEQVPVNEDLRSVLTDEPGRAALREARADALERRDLDQVAEIDRFLNKPEAAPGVVKLPPVEAPAAPLPPEDPAGPSILTFLRQQGGVRDPGGELSRMDLGRSYGKFQRDHIVNPNGISLEEAAHRAWEAGFFPNAKFANGGEMGDYHPVDEQMLLDELRRVVGGQKTSGAWIGEEDLAAQNRWMDDAEDTLPPIDEGYWASLEEGAPETLSGAVLDRAQIAMRERGNRFAAKGNNARAGGAYGRQAVVNQTLDNVEGLAPARADYRAKSQAIDVLGRGRKDAFSTDPRDYAGWLKSLSPEAREANKVAIRQEVLDTLGGQRSATFGSVDELATSQYAQQNLRQALGPEADQYLAYLRNKLDQVRNARFVDSEAGSRTAVVGQDMRNLGNVIREGAGAVAEAKTGNFPMLMARGANWLASRGFSERDAQALTRMVVDPRQTDRAIQIIGQRLGPEAAKAAIDWRRAVLLGGTAAANAQSASQ